MFTELNTFKRNLKTHLVGQRCIIDYALTASYDTDVVYLIDLSGALVKHVSQLIFTIVSCQPPNFPRERVLI